MIELIDNPYEYDTLNNSQNTIDNIYICHNISHSYTYIIPKNFQEIKLLNSSSVITGIPSFLASALFPVVLFLLLQIR